jgi:ferredoxin
MSAQPGLSRRALLGLFRRPSAESHAPVSAVAPAAFAGSRGPAAGAGPATSVESRAPVASAVSSVSAARAVPIADVGPRASVAAGRSVGPASSSSPSPAFSLESFYAGRAASGQASADGRIPLFSLREGLPTPQTETAALPTVRPATDARALREGLPVPQRGTPEVPAGPSAPSALGATVRVRTGHCLAWQGSFCTTCVERCPIPGAIVMEAGRPRVVAERCDGCGTCVRVCPAPLNAFELRPASTPGATSS